MDGWQQQGMTLIEVLVAMAVLGLGLFAAAGLQVQALQATESALNATQSAYLEHGRFELMHAGGAGQ
ncbi:prepilin-type N-terminal cleavage/methylation domain-containing protein [Pseudomonas sp. H9]|uniref:type IV pilus modification PilV family protein n=1 Tax=Pseudomonas sp. H9 TaxID=483968 RepID=UPI0010578919|nr:prepilin-type N-terminal cleavage/methylation domain-containing protein [Pseudomonas sp. H9]TDF80268.1 prepilin-type N-terminal cleavage/methylation domain-containing protein [Pseudomonas sp. H9]